MFLSPDEVPTSPAVAQRWVARKRCSPSATAQEDRWPEAREWLDAHGYDDTLAYVRAMAIRVLEATGLPPRLNPGVLSWTDHRRGRRGQTLAGTRGRLRLRQGAGPRRSASHHRHRRPYRRP